MPSAIELKGRHLAVDEMPVFNMMLNMTLSTRSFVQNLAKAKQAAARGEVVRIVDRRSGTTFHFMAAPRSDPGVLSDLVARYAGVYRSRIKDLSMREGFDGCIPAS